jgi:uncharacterized LabA/DUF88 family protein
MTKKAIVYAFIDSQNLNLGVQSQGWQIDYKKFRLYLRNKYGVKNAYIFIGFVLGNEDLYESLQKAGYILVFKPTVQYFENGKSTVKGNVDAELVLHAAAIEYSHYDKAIIVSGDGDFTCLVKFLSKHGKLLHVFAPNKRYSKLLVPFSQYIVNMQRLRLMLEYKKDQHRRSVETLGLSGHGDTSTIVAKPNKNNKRGRI